MAIFGDIATPEERLDFIEGVINNKIDHLNAEFDFLMMEHEENILAIENKVLMESGTESDLVELYAFEAEDTKQAGKGILGKIFDAIAKFFRGIKEFLFGKKNNVTEENLPDTVELPHNPDELMKEAKTAHSSLMSSVASNNFVKLGAVAVSAAVAAGMTVKVAKNKVIPYTKDVEDYAKAIDDDLMKAKETLDNKDLSTEDQSAIKKFISKLQKIASAMKTDIQLICKYSKEQEFKDFRDNKEKESEDEEKENKPSKDEKKKADNDKVIKDEEEHQDRINVTWAQIQDRRDEIDKELDSLNSKIKSLQNRKNNKIRNLIRDVSKSKDEVQAEKDIARLNELKRKTIKSSAEKAEYNDLHEKYGNGNIPASDIDKKLKELIDKRDALIDEDKELNKRSTGYANNMKSSQDKIDKAKYSNNKLENKNESTYDLLLSQINML